MQEFIILLIALWGHRCETFSSWRQVARLSQAFIEGHRRVLTLLICICKSVRQRYTASLTSHVRGELGCEVPQAGEFGAQVELRLIEQNGQDCLGGAGIVNDLFGKEDLAMIVAMLQSRPVIFL